MSVQSGSELIEVFAAIAFSILASSRLSFCLIMHKLFFFAEMIVINFVGIAASSLFMVFLPLYGSSVVALFWIGVGGIGIFSASIYGTLFVWAERYITVNARFVQFDMICI